MDIKLTEDDFERIRRFAAKPMHARDPEELMPAGDESASESKA